MQSTTDWEDEMPTKSQREGNSSEDMTTSALQLDSAVASSLVPYRATIIAISALGILASMVVIVGLWLAGRSKMNASSAYIANHTTLEQQTFSSIFRTVVFDLYTSPYSTNC